jgi:subtilisin family serine protease
LAKFKRISDSSIIASEITALDARIISDQGAEVAPSEWNQNTQLYRSFSGDATLFRLKLPEYISVENAIAILKANPDVEYAYKNIRLHPLAEDPLYGEQWALSHIHAPEAWSIYTGSADIIVAVIDTGMALNHPDLQSNLWINPGEDGLDGYGNPKSSNNVDDDHNGKTDDYCGWDFGHNDNDPSEDDGVSHGTHMPGIIGATWNNDEGIKGINQHVSIMVLKFTNKILSTDTAYASEFINAIDHAINNGASIISCSQGFKPEFEYDENILFEYLPFKEAIQRARARGVLFVAAAGNDAVSIEPGDSPLYPPSYDEDNIISVLATTIENMPGGCSGGEEHLDDQSNYGPSSVDIGAPGVCIWTTESNGGYGFPSGTSEAAPQVAGVAALLLGKCPALTYNLLKSRLMDTGDSLATLQGKCVSGKRVNAYLALYDPFHQVAPNAPSILNACATAWNTIVIHWQDNSSDEVGFEIQRYNSDKPVFQRYASVGQQITTFVDQHAYTRSYGGGIVHSYRVRAGNIGGGVSTFSGTVNAYVPYTAPAAPSAFAAETSIIPNIVLAWNDNSNNELTFIIERKKTGPWTQVAVVGANSTTYTDHVTLPGLYYYRMKAQNPVGNSAYSNQITVEVENW